MQTSFIESANNPDGPFPLNNLPYGVCKPSRNSDATAVVVAIGHHVLDLAAVATQVPSVFTGPLLPASEAAKIFSSDSLNPFLSLGCKVWREVRNCITDALSATPLNDALKLAIGNPSQQQSSSVLLPLLRDVQMLLPVQVGDYTDFYSSIAHASNVGTMFRGKDNALPQSWLHMPIAYHGRASSVIPSGTSFPRPSGQLSSGPQQVKRSPCARLDYELEMGVVIGGKENPLGDSVSVDEAADRVFGFTLMNDWSARDVQKWEYVPLGPFTAKNFATTISPFVVPLDALLPFRSTLPTQNPQPLPYLQGNQGEGVHCAFDVDLQVAILPKDDTVPSVVTRSNLKNLYWSVAQQIAHHTVTGCNLRPGDLLGSGTISGENPESFGCLLELSWNGTKKVYLKNSVDGATRTFLEDGDTVIITGMARGNGYCIGFGECTGQILPSKSSD